MPDERATRLMDAAEFRQTAIPLHNEMLSLWEDLRGDPVNPPPPRKSITLTKVGRNAKYISVTELTEDGRLKLKLSSTLFDEFSGTARSGLYLTDVLNPGDYEILAPLLMSAIRTPCGLYTDQIVVLSNSKTYNAKTLFLPCTKNGLTSSVMGSVFVDNMGMKHYQADQNFAIVERIPNETIFIDLSYGLPEPGNPQV